jgi:hypothetical protein
MGDWMPIYRAINLKKVTAMLTLRHALVAPAHAKRKNSATLKNMQELKRNWPKTACLRFKAKASGSFTTQSRRI